MNLQVISIVGPTGSGKSALAIDLALELQAEIVSLDAYQIYRQMDVGTAKPSPSQLRQVPHHLIDVVGIEHPASLAEFQQWAHAAIGDINSRGKVAICVGGSGLYVRAVLNQLDLPPTDAAIRQRYQTLLETHGEEFLWNVLLERDSAAANFLSPHDSRRVIRALEVGEITGEPFRAELPQTPSLFRDLRFGLLAERDLIQQRIADRCHHMWNSGWVEETRTLSEQGLFETPTASRALGYDTVQMHIDGHMTALEAQAAIAQATTKFSRRQMQWFRRDTEITWLDLTSSENHVSRIVASIAQYAVERADE